MGLEQLNLFSLGDLPPKLEKNKTVFADKKIKVKVKNKNKEPLLTKNP